MVPPLALQAAGGLLFTLLSIYPFLTDQETVSKYLVGDLSSGGNEDDMATCLVAGPLVHGLDPSCAKQRTGRQVVILLYPAYFHLLLQLKVKEDELYHR